MNMNLLSRCHVPDSLESITTRSEAEVEPRSVGATRAGVNRIWEAACGLYRSGMHPMVQLCIRRHGEVVLDRAIGHAAGNGPEDAADTKKTLATTETPSNIFSASKAVTAMVIHLLDQKHVLHVHDPVTEYIPEFGKHGKDRLTIEHVLTHRAGIPNVPPEEMKLEYLTQPEQILQMLYDTEPTWVPGRRLAYHAITGGFILGEIVRRATGRSIRRVLQDEILGPLGFRWMNYGVKPRDVGRVAQNYFTGPPPFPPMSWLLRRVLGVGPREVSELSNDKRFLTEIRPSANIITTANELSRFYQLLLNGGELDGIRIFEPRTIHRATSEQSYLEFDFTLGLPLRYSMGFMLGGIGLYGPDTPHSFGHVGYINVFSWADPERQISVALTNTGKPILYPEIYFVHEIMKEISEAFSKQAPRASAGGSRRRPERPKGTRAVAKASAKGATARAKGAKAGAKGAKASAKGATASAKGATARAKGATARRRKSA